MSDTDTPAEVTETARPANAKKPQDRKEKAPTPDKDGLIKVKVRGLSLKVSADALDDFELLDDLNELEANSNPARLPSVLRRLVGDQWGDVVNHLRGDNGRVSVEDGAEFIGELLVAVNPNS